eukprot:scaffold8.g1405.t1
MPLAPLQPLQRPFALAARLTSSTCSPLGSSRPFSSIAARSAPWRVGAGDGAPSGEHQRTSQAGAAGMGSGLSDKDRQMARLFMAGCFHYWDQLPDAARALYAAGASVAEVRGTVRHMVVVAGYGPCLAATLALHKAGLLPEDAPVKAGGPPGNAFELVYSAVSDRVRANMHAADPGLGEWIRTHAYGDVYSSPGLTLAQKQILMCAFLSEADMHDQLFGHAFAGLRFGAGPGALQEAARLACEMAPAQRPGLLGRALKTLDLAHAKYAKDFRGRRPRCPEVSVPDPASVRVPPPYVPPPDADGNDGPEAGEEQGAAADAGGRTVGGAGGGGGDPLLQRRLEQLALLEAGGNDDAPLFAWEAADSRHDPGSRTWGPEPLPGEAS